MRGYKGGGCDGSLGTDFPFSQETAMHSDHSLLALILAVGSQGICGPGSTVSVP